MWFDVIAYLDAQNVMHSTEKNVSPGWTGIRCRYPSCADNSNHLGINLKSGLHKCFKCGHKGGPEQLVMLIEQCQYPQAKDRVREFSTGILGPAEGPEIVGTFMLPKFAAQQPAPAHVKYLHDRGYDPGQLVSQYGVSFTGPVSWVNTSQGQVQYPWRIVIPIYIDGVIVNFTSRDITGRASSKYKMAPDGIALRPGRDVVYNIDNTSRCIACVEGPFDVWRIGYGAVAVLGTVFTEEQLALITARRPERVYVIYDPDASEIAEHLAARLIRLVPQVDILYLDQGDPDTMTLADLQYIQHLLAA